MSLRCRQNEVGIVAGSYVEPLGTAAVSYVDVRDLAAVAVVSYFSA